MKNLIIQTYIEDTVDRNTQFTYKKFPKLERLSRKCFERYAKVNGADYEYYTPEEGEAHWIRMVMFDRPEYDNVLYVDCDILIHPRRYDDNIFEQEGSFVNKIWAFEHCNAVPGVAWPNHPSGEFNAGVMKISKVEAEIMKDKIGSFYHPTHNQTALNDCWNTHVGPWKALPYRFNVTHRPTTDITFRHYPGMQKAAVKLKQCPIWRHYK